MNLLWDRSVALTFGPKKGEQIKVTGLRVSFEVEKTSEAHANTAKIMCWNVSSKSWALLESAVNPVVILEGGYGGNLDEIFYGDVKKSTFTNDGPNTLATIEAGDGTQALQEATFSKSYKAGVSLKIVTKELLQSFKDTGRTVIDKAIQYLESNEVPDKKAQAGLCLEGVSKNILDKITGALGLEWSIQDNEVQVIPAGGNTQEEAVLLTPQTGLIGSPVRREEGIEFTALIQANIRPARLVQIKSKDIEGKFRIKKARFTGDTEDQHWYVTAEVIEE